MIPDGTSTVAKAEGSLKKWITGSKSPGAIILEHELADTTVQVFMDSYPLIKQNGWNFMSLARALDDGNPYENSVVNSTSASAAPSGSQSGSSATASKSTTPSSAAVVTSPVSQTLLFFLILTIPLFA
jgi:chitin deacetylase